MLSTDQKGAIAESAIVAAATRFGIGVYKPMFEGGRYDLIFDLGALVRVQCKWAAKNGDVLVIRYSCRRTRDGLVRRFYTADEVDVFAAYCMDLDCCYYLPVRQFAGRGTIQLRLAPTLNNQQRGVNWAADFEFGRLDWSAQGAVAQLGERLAGSQ